MSIIIYIATMAAVTYLIRMIPFTVFRKQIESKFIKSVLFYLPYTVLSAMTLPAIFYSTGSLESAIVGTVVAVVVAFFDKPLILVALAAAVSAFAVEAVM